MQKYLKMVALIMIGILGNLYSARPFGTDDAGTVTQGSYELELGYDIWKETGSFSLSFKHGLTQKMDIGVGFGFNIVSEPKNSFLPSEVSLKYGLIPELFATSFTAEIGSPAYTINGILSRVFGPFKFDANLGYSTGDSSVIYGSALLYGAGNFIFGGEVNGNRETQTWLVGGSYTIKEGLLADAGFTSDFKFEEKVATFGFHYEF